MAKGRQKGQIVERKERPKGFVTLTETIRLRIEPDSIIWEEVNGKDKETEELTYGNNKYFTSWKGVLDYLIRRMTTEKISKAGIVSFTEARKLILDAINECRDLFFSEINATLKSANDDMIKNIKKFAR